MSVHMCAGQAEAMVRYLREFQQRSNITVHYGVNVTSIERRHQHQPFTLHTSADRRYRCRWGPERKTCVRCACHYYSRYMKTYVWKRQACYSHGSFSVDMPKWLYVVVCNADPFTGQGQSALECTLATPAYETILRWVMTWKEQALLTG